MEMMLKAKLDRELRKEEAKKVVIRGFQIIVSVQDQKRMIEGLEPEHKIIEIKKNLAFSSKLDFENIRIMSGNVEYFNTQTLGELGI